MDLHLSHGQAYPSLRLPAGIVHSADMVEDTELLTRIYDSPGICPMKMSKNYRKQRNRFPYKSQRKNG